MLAKLSSGNVLGEDDDAESDSDEEAENDEKSAGELKRGQAFASCFPAARSVHLKVLGACPLRVSSFNASSSGAGML